MELASLAEARAYLDGFLNLEKIARFPYEKLGLERIQALLRGIGSPERGLSCVHIAGSKGKGSTALLCEGLLRGAGLRTGTYTSPHLECWTERFRIDGRPVSEADLLRALRVLRPVAERQRLDPRLRPSFFDVTTALALLLFRDLGMDAAVVEVGLGGRIDSTNVVESRVSVISSIQLEHTDKLGHTLEAIAREKAGILRKGVPGLHGPLAPEALAAVLARAVAADTPIEEVRGEVLEVHAGGQTVRLPDGRTCRTLVSGRHQAHNVALSVRAAECFAGAPATELQLEALGAVRVPARFECFGPQVVLDCAHTVDSIRALRLTLEERFGDARWVCLVSISRDKDAGSMLQELATHACVLVACVSEPVRSLPAEEIEALGWACGIEQVQAVPDPARALGIALEAARPGDVVVIAGSVYLAGAVRRTLCEIFGEG